MESETVKLIEAELNGGYQGWRMQLMLFKGYTVSIMQNEYFKRFNVPHGNSSFFFFFFGNYSSVQFSHSVVSNLCNPMNRSTPGLHVHHQLPEFTQTHDH